MCIIFFLCLYFDGCFPREFLVGQLTLGSLSPHSERAYLGIIGTHVCDALFVCRPSVLKEHVVHLLRCNTKGGWWRWTLVSPDGVAPSRMVGVSASVNLPLHHKVQRFSSGTGSPGWSQKKGHKMVVV